MANKISHKITVCQHFINRKNTTAVLLPFSFLPVFRITNKKKGPALGGTLLFCTPGLIYRG